MTTLLIAEHDNASVKDSTNKALTAAAALGAEVHVLVAGENAKAAAEAVAKLAGVRKVLLADGALPGRLALARLVVVTGKSAGLVRQRDDRLDRLPHCITYATIRSPSSQALSAWKT